MLNGCCVEFQWLVRPGHHYRVTIDATQVTAVEENAEGHVSLYIGSKCWLIRGRYEEVIKKLNDACHNL